MNTIKSRANYLFIALVILLSGITAFSQSSASTNYEVDVEQTTIEDANKLVSDLLKNSKIVSKEFFCVKNDIICRVHYTLADLNGNLIAPFYVRFMAADRSAASQGYFFPAAGKSGHYVRFEDFTFDSTVNINQVVKENTTAVEKNEKGQPTAIRGSVLPKLGTTKYTVADVIISEKMTVIEGDQFDSSDPTFNAHVRTEYLRTNITE